MQRPSLVNLFTGEDPEGDADANGIGHPQDVDEGPPEAEVAQLTPHFHEQAAILSFAMEMRNESSFCDVSFVVTGSIFRAHRVIVRQDLVRFA